jgi:Aerotolerance regulator N-terminal
MPDGFAFEAPELLRLLWGLPIVVLLYLFRRRARRHLVPFLPFWQRVFAEKRRRPTFLRALLSILLQLVAASAAVVALARPYREEWRAVPVRSVLDWTLGTRMAEGGRPLAEAVAARGREVAARAMTEGPVSVALLRRGLEPRPADAPAADVGAAELPPPAGTRRLEDLDALRRASDDETRIFFVTPFLVPPDRLPGATVLGVATAELRNGGIRGVELPPGEGSLLVRVESGGKDRTLRLVGVDSAELAAAAVPAAGTGEVRLPVPPDGADGAALRLDPADGFPEDDACPLELPARGKLRVLVASDVATPALDSALVASSVMDAAGSGRVPLAKLAEVAASFDVAIVVGAGATADPPPGRYLLLESFPRSLPVSARAGAGETRALRKSSGPAWLKALDVDEWRIHRMPVVEAGPGLEVLVESGRGPLVARAEAAGIRAIVVSVRPDVTASTLPLLPAFPLMLRGALLELVPSSATTGSVAHRAGGRIVLGAAEAAAFAAADGTPRPLRMARDGGGFELPEEPGRWTVGTRRIATAWLDHPALPGPARTSDDPWPKAPRRTERRFLQGEVLLVLIAVLLVEWCSYHFGGTD